MVRFGIVLLGAVMLGACGGGSGGSSSSGGDGSSGGETSYAGPIGSTDVAHGETRYNAACGSCHNNGAPPIANLGWTPERMRQQIREGGGNMPAIREARLSAPDMEALLAYLVTVGAVQGDAGAAPAAEATP
jgi:mono/diheme cytochrome c family protein